MQVSKSGCIEQLGGVETGALVDVSQLRDFVVPLNGTVDTDHTMVLFPIGPSGIVAMTKPELNSELGPIPMGSAWQVTHCNLHRGQHCDKDPALSLHFHCPVFHLQNRSDRS